MVLEIVRRAGRLWWMVLMALCLTACDPISDIVAVSRAEVGVPVSFKSVLKPDMAQMGAQDLSYEWDFGDGNTAQGIEVQHTYASVGDYQVVLRVITPSLRQFGQAYESTAVISVLPASGSATSLKVEVLTVDGLAVENAFVSVAGQSAMSSSGFAEFSSVPAGALIEVVAPGYGSVLRPLDAQVDATSPVRHIRIILRQLDELASRPVTVVVVGDSRTVGIGTAGVHGDQAFHFNNSLAMLGPRVKLLKNVGVGGFRLDQVVSQQLPLIDRMPQWPDWIVVDAGFNDINQGQSLEDVLQDHAALIAWAQQRGIGVLDYTSVPATSLTPQTKAVLQQFNAYKRSQTTGYDRYVIIDGARHVTDAESGDLLPGLADDGVHLNAKGAWLVALGVQSDLERVFSPRPEPRLDLLGGLQLARNPTLSGDNPSGQAGWLTRPGVSGTGPDGWEVGRIWSGTATASCSKIPLEGAESAQAGLRLTWSAGDDITQGLYAQAPITAIGPWQSARYMNKGDRVSVSKDKGIQYLAINAGSLAAGEDPTARWSRMVGEVFVSGSVTLQVVKGVYPGTPLSAVFHVPYASSNGPAYLKTSLIFFDSNFQFLGEIYGHRSDATHTASIDSRAYRLITFPSAMPEGTAYILTRLEIKAQAGVQGVVDISRAEILAEQP